MPAYSELSIPASTRLPAQKAIVVISGNVFSPEKATCLSAERRCGLMPGKAQLRFDTAAFQHSPITLNAQMDQYGYSKFPTQGSRIVLRIAEQDIWRGWLVRRQDDGDSDQVSWTALEDQWLLSKIFMRGCFVYDAKDAVVKYVESFTPTTNPGGLWNCIHAPINGVLYPVFAATAKRIMGYETPEFTTVGEGALGEYCAWTPRRFLYYLSLVLARPTTPGLGWASGSFTPLVKLNSNYITLLPNAIQSMKGYDAAFEKNQMGLEQVDPLDRKLLTMSFQGMTWAAAMDQVLQSIGTHDAVMRFSAPDMPTHLEFAPIFWSGNESGKGRSIVLPRRGNLETSNIAYSFSLLEDITDYAEDIVVDGAPVKGETQLFCRTDNLGIVDPVSTLKPFWTLAEESAFQKCIYGARVTEPQGKYAKYPRIPGDTNFDNFISADGSLDGGVRRPSISACSDGAVQLAMQMFPTVYRAFYIDTAALNSAGVFDGADGRFSDRQRFARLNYYRPIYSQQLQFLTLDSGKEDMTKQSDWIRYSLPVRVSVQLGNNQIHDMAYQAGIHVSGDGIIWLDQFGIKGKAGWDNIIGRAEDSYANNGFNYQPLDLRLRSIFINAAFPFDWRVTGRFVNRNPEGGGGWGVSDKLFEALNGPPMAYFDNIYDYQEWHQVNSQPTANPVYVGATQFPLTRILPPGSEKYSADYAAQRKCRYLSAPKRQSIWRLPGINLGWQPGEFVESIIFTGVWNGVSTTEPPYMIRASIPTILYDFVLQRTEFGGLQSSFAV